MGKGRKKEKLPWLVMTEGNGEMGDLRHWEKNKGGPETEWFWVSKGGLASARCWCRSHLGHPRRMEHLINPSPRVPRYLAQWPSDGLWQGRLINQRVGTLQRAPLSVNDECELSIY